MGCIQRRDVSGAAQGSVMSQGTPGAGCSSSGTVQSHGAASGTDMAAEEPFLDTEWVT